VAELTREAIEHTIEMYNHEKAAMSESLAKIARLNNCVSSYKKVEDSQ
jgi:hypothetical protein